MSKKLIAVAAAAALALTALVAAPANSAAITSVAVVHAGAAAATGDGGTTANLTVSQTNSDAALAAPTAATSRTVIFGNSTDTATRTALRATVTTASAATITVTSTLGVKIATSITDGTGAAIKVDGGSQSISGTNASASTTFVFYAWNTSTTPGAVTVDTGTSKLTFYVKGTLYAAYNLTDVTFPASLYVGQTDGKVTYKLSDPYGNPITTGTGLTLSGFGGTFTTAATYSSVTKLWSAPIATVTGDNVALNLTFNSEDLSANGFAKPVTSSFKVVAGGDLSAKVATLTTQVTSLQASVTALTADYNKLATRWNTRYDLKKAPKHKVVLK
jgi:hypothetical protein